MKKTTRILIVEDIATDADLAKRAIGKVLKHCEFQVVETRKDFLGALETFQPDVILSDYSLPHFDGMKALKLTLKHAPLTPLIIWTGSMSEDIAVDCMKAGANNYVLKENIKRLGPAILHALKERQLLLERRQAEEKYQAIFDNSVGGVFQSVPEGRFINVNAAMARIYGYDSPQEMIEAVETIPEQIYTDSSRRAEFTALLHSEGSVENYEQTNYRKDGSVIWTSTSARAVRDLNGQVLYYEGFITDITTRKTMEKKLQESETKYRTLVEHLPAITYISEPDQYMGVTYISPQIQSLGFSATEWFADPELWFKQIHPEDQGRVLSELQQFQDGAPTFRAEYRLRRPNGETRWFHDECTYVRDQDGKPILKQGIMLDISERRQAEEALQNSEKRFRALFEDMPIPIWEEDFSEVKEYLDSLKQQGITDFREYFKTHPEAVVECADRIRVLGVNRATLQMYQAAHKNDLLEKVNKGLSTSDLEYLQEALVSITEGKTRYMWEGTDETIRGKAIKVNIVASVIPGYESDLSKVIVAITDITERKQAEEALRNSEKRFRALMENGLDNISLLTAEGVLIWQSPAAIRMLGYAADEFVRQNIFKLMHPDDLGWTVGLFSQLIQEPGSRQHGIFRLRHANGTWRWVEAIVTNMLDEPAVKAIVVNSRDITERKQAEEALRESQAKYQNLVETSHDLIWSTDAEGRITFLNRATKEIYGYEPEELIGHSFFELLDKEYYHPEDFEKLREMLAHASEFSGIETYIRHRDGRQIILSANSIVIRDEQGNVTGITGSSHDITMRKRVEDVLKAERNLLRTLIDNIPDRIYAMDMQGRKMLTNTADWKASGGKTMEEILGKTDFETYPTDLAEEFWKLNKAVLESGISVINHEEPGLDENGNRLSILATKIPLRDEDGKVIGLVGVGRDITERKEIEARINDLLAFNEKILNYSPLGMLTYKLTGKCVFANENAASTMGASIEQLQAQNFHTIESWKRSGLYDLVEKAVVTQTAVTADIHHLSTFGKDVWITAHCTTFKSKDEEHVLLSIRDITDRKQAEEKLRQSENRYRLALQATNDVVWEWDAQADQLFWSDNASILFGYAPEDIAPYAKWWDEHIHPDDRDRVVTKLSSFVQGQESLWQDEYRFLCKNGSYAYISDRGYIERDASDTAVRIIGAMSDITERKQADEKLLRSQQELAEAQRVAKIGSWTFDAESGCISWSDELYHVYGVEKETFDLTYDPFMQLVHPDDRARVSQTNRSTLLEGRPFDIEYRVITPSGERKTVSEIGYAIKDTHGNVVGLFGTAQDITTRKQAETERQALLEIMQGLADTNDLQELLRLIHHSIAKVIYAENFFVALHHSNSGLFEEIYCVDQYDPPAPPSKLEKSITSYVFRSGEPLLLTQAQYDELVAQGEVQLIGTDSKSWLGVPLKTSGRTIGVMAVQDYEIDDRYSERDRDFLASIAAQVALVIERKQAEEALRDSEERFSRAFEYAPIGIGLVSPDGHWLRVNKSLCELVGYSQEELLSKTFQEITHPDDLEADLQFVRQMLAEEIDSYQIEKRYFHKLGHPRWILLSVSLVRDNHGAPHYFISQVQDITERKKAQIELQQKNDDLRLLNAVNEAVVRGENLDSIIELLAKGIRHIFADHRDTTYSTIYMLSPDKQSLVMQKYFFSPETEQKLERLLGFALPKIEFPLQGGGHFHRAMTSKAGAITSDPEGIKNWIAEFAETKFLSPLVKPIVQRLIPRIYQLLNIKSVIVVPLISEDETIGFLEVSGSDLFTANDLKRIENIGGQLTAAIQRQRANEKILRSEEFLHSIQNALSASIAILNETGTIVRVNSAWREFGERNGLVHPETCVGLNYLEICDSAAGLHAEEAPLVAQIIRSVIAGQRNDGRVEYPCHSPEENRWFTLQITKFEDGEHLWVVLAHEDITERKQAELAEREQRALAEALRDTAETLSRTLDYGEVLDHILAAVGRVVPHDAASILLVEGDSSQMVRSHGYEKHGYEPKTAGVRLPLAETTNLRQMLESRQPVVIHDTQSYPGWLRLPSTEWVRSNVGVPISLYGEVTGFICLDSQTPEFFTPVHAERLEAFANQAALAIHNARLLRQAQEELAERKQAEKELRDSEERFRQLADNIQEGFWITEAESGQEIYMSPAVEKIWDQPLEKLMHEPDAFINTVYPQDRPRVLQAIEKQRKGEKAEVEYRILQRNGSLRWVWDRAFPIFDESGRVQRVAGISADVTERREAELALIQSQSRYRELFDGSPISIWEEDFSQVKQQIDRLLESGITDLNGYFSNHQDELAQLASLVKITNANQAALDLYSVERKEVVLTGLTQVISKDALSHFRQEIAGLISPSRRFVWEGSDNMRNGRQLEILVTGSIPQGYEKDWSKVLVSVTDITERKRAEEELRRRAEETSALLETSLALTSLDLKTTLRTISSSAKALFAADGCRIFLMEPDNETLRCVLALQENSRAFEDLRFKIGEGVTGTVAATGRAEIVNEMQNDPRAVQIPGTLDKEVEAIMFAPLKERDRTIGVLSIRRVGAERFFQPTDLELLEAFAAMAASSVSNARLFEETQRRLSELEAIYENGLAVGRLLKPGDIGNQVIATFARYLRWHHVTIRLRREDSDELELVAFNLPNLKEEERANAEQHFIAQISKVGQGLSGQAIQSGEPLRTGNVHAHPQYINTHSGIQSGLYMPFKVGERVIGVISVESEVPNAFTGQDERLLATLASQAAIAFENARLYETIQKELSERKRAEEALRASEAHYRELADSITDILFELDYDLHFTHWNKASEVLTGIPVEHAMGKSMHEIFGESEEQVRIGKIYEEVLKSRQPKTFETALELGGAKRSFEINAYPSRRGVSVVAKDVTDRKRSETIMQKRFELMEYSAHHTLNELMQRTVDEVSEVTESTIGFFHFVEADQNNLGMQTWSTNALRMFNIPLSEGAHLPLDQAGIWAEAVRQRRSSIQNDYASLPNTKGLPEGHVPILREIVIPILRSDKVVAVMGIGNKAQDYTPHDLEIAERLADYAWDITERKQMEIALERERNQLAQRVEERTADLSRANSNLARALRVKDEFLANMSHELRTPLNAILGLSESLGEQIAGPLNEKQQKYITTISESGHHLLSLINDILDLAKIEAGQITLDINKVDIHSVCQASLRMVKQLAQKKNQEVTLTIESGLGLMWADERRLKQMIVNLLGNAVKFTPENGRIGLEVHGDQEANKITITVWDNGIGISAEHLARLFQPFVQLDSGLARETTGTGLGLALVAQMARLHGGSVNVSSEPGVGSRFSIVLPWEPALALDSNTRLRMTGKFPAVRPDETKKPTILLVEDTREVVMLIQDYLELAGYRVVTAQDGLDAVVQAKLVHPDLILMDVQMPRMDGLEAARKLRSEPDFRYTPIIALTALAMPTDRERCLAAGMDEYISKPINLKALVRLIQSCLFRNEEVTHP